MPKSTKTTVYRSGKELESPFSSRLTCTLGELLQRKVEAKPPSIPPPPPLPREERPTVVPRREPPIELARKLRRGEVLRGAGRSLGWDGGFVESLLSVYDASVLVEYPRTWRQVLRGLKSGEWGH